MLSTWDLVVLDTGQFLLDSFHSSFDCIFLLDLPAWHQGYWYKSSLARWESCGCCRNGRGVLSDVLPWAPLLDPQNAKRFHVRGCHQHKERYRTYDQSGHYGGFGQGASCHFFLKLKPYWNQLLNFSCCDIARPEEWWSNDDQCFLCFLLWRAGGDLVLYGASHTKDWRGRGICDLSPLMSFAFPFDKRQTTSNSHHALASTGGYFWYTLDSGHFQGKGQGLPHRC